MRGYVLVLEHWRFQCILMDLLSACFSPKMGALPLYLFALSVLLYFAKCLCINVQLCV